MGSSDFIHATAETKSIRAKLGSSLRIATFHKTYQRVRIVLWMRLRLVLMPNRREQNHVIVHPGTAELSAQILSELGAVSSRKRTLL